MKPGLEVFGRLDADAALFGGGEYAKARRSLFDPEYQERHDPEDGSIHRSISFRTSLAPEGAAEAIRSVRRVIRSIDIRGDLAGVTLGVRFEDGE